MNNDLNALNNYLFEAIERINDDSLEDAQVDLEIKKAKAIKDVAETIISGAKLGLDAQKYIYESGSESKIAIPLLNHNDKC